MRNVGPETKKYLEDIPTYKWPYFKFTDEEYNGLDIGAKGAGNHDSISDNAISVDLDYPGYDGITLPFSDESQDFVYSSHALEHIPNQRKAIQEWYRVTRESGVIFIIVPHQFLYERKACLPSAWNLDHKRFYTPALLLAQVEIALVPNTYRIIQCRDLDMDYDYSLPINKHPVGNYSIELIIQKITPPTWELK